MTDNSVHGNPAIWKQDFMVTHYFVDPDGMASIHGLASFLQEVAHNHASARSLGFEDLIKENKTWVLTRQAIKLIRVPVLGDAIKIESWVEETTPAFSVRDFHILNTGDEVIGMARTSLMMLDIILRKPVKIPDKVLELIPKTPGRLREDLPLDKLQVAVPGIAGSDFEVKYSDLDMNNHVNNITYIRWVSDNFTRDFRQNNRLVSLEINYLNEALYSEKLNAATYPAGEPNTFQTIIRRSEDQHEIFVARTFWAVKTS
ncbi:MAG TPA: acyl-ACP thioesterase domain-containing protein [Cyclobacteriaceae bacterium]|nr:acyl-ACP thioesterase domain-containing protein [Cyclobacteriaceae bacterium]